MPCLAIAIELINVIVWVIELLLGAFTKVQKTIISFVMFVCLCAWNYWAPAGQIFMKFDIWLFLENLLEKFKFH